GSGLPLRKKPPVGPLSGSVAAHNMLAAPSAAEAGAADPPMSVATQPDILVTPLKDTLECVQMKTLSGPRVQHSLQER
ncbi:MAG TPA: hypothetical protein VMT53_18385, partial [Terriglobales bacterium]|nr:hypothetical protein [Terriglobales bacterium]